MSEQLAYVTVRATPSAIRPLQLFVRELASPHGLSDDQLLHLELLVEELFAGIAGTALPDGHDGEISLSLSVDPGSLLLAFHYRGIPFGYDIDNPADERGRISMELIHAVSSSFKIREDGKAGQHIEVRVAKPADPAVTGRSAAIISHTQATPEPRATDGITVRHITDADMQSLVQCLHSVFGYTYAAADMYSPDALRRKRAAGTYDGIVAVNSSGRIVAHVAALKTDPADHICECGQAFVTPAYGGRGLFTTLKQELISTARAGGLEGVFSSAVTGHPLTQRANLSLGCVETGLEIGYIPADVESMIHRTATGKRQPVMTYFKPTDAMRDQQVCLPPRHATIITETYARGMIPRQVTTVSPVPLPTGGGSVIDAEVNNIWNHVHINVVRADSRDFVRRVEGVLRRSSAAGCAVCYISLPLNDPLSASLSEILEEECGFFYAGVMPCEAAGIDTVRLQCLLADDPVTTDDVIAESQWGATLRDYVFHQRELHSL